MTDQMAKTPAGRAAYQIRDWVFMDPAARAAPGMDRINELARNTADKAALNEISDAGTMVHRLLPARPANITDQVRGSAA